MISSSSSPENDEGDDSRRLRSSEFEAASSLASIPPLPGEPNDCRCMFKRESRERKGIAGERETVMLSESQSRF